MKPKKPYTQTTCLVLSAMLFVFILSQPCHAKKAVYVPEILQPWVEWVLHDREKQRACIPSYDDADTVQCSWPSEIEMTLHDQGGEFKQTWLVQLESWVALPGNNLHWPRDVEVDGEKRTILEKNNIPEIHLQPGLHRITGRFVWPRLPENLQVPLESALVSLTVNHEKITFPDLDMSGLLWLKRVQEEEKIENRLKIESFRLINDSIPSRVMLHFTLDVSGSAREITLGPLYDPQRFTPISLAGALPARLEQDGAMLLQARPGQYSIRLDLRHTGPLGELVCDFPDDGFWPREEIWSFQAHPDIRLVEIDGVPPIDPLTTSMPKDWQAWPAYRILPGESMRFKEIKQGDPNPAPDLLTLERVLWLRFDGSGYTIQDTINGKKNTNWRLEMDPAITLGRVAVDGTERFITRRKDSNKAGVELRNGILNLTADSVYQGKISSIPATGWDHHFQQVKGRLHLPPGWALLHAGGMDTIARTWIKRWTLLDFFIVLIFTIALVKLFSKSLAAIAFLTLVLIYHEPGAPRYIWIALLAGFAFLKYLPDGKLKKAVKVYQYIAAAVLAVIVIPYAIQALRIGIYPQLAMPWTSMTAHSLRPKALSSAIVSEETRMAEDMSVQEMRPSAPTLGMKKSADKYERLEEQSQAVLPKSSYYKAQVMQYDPKAINQTGPGMPRWPAFETIEFSWSGPVTCGRTLSLTLIGPATNLILAFVRVFLIILLTLGLFGIRYRKKDGLNDDRMKTMTFFSFLVFVLMIPNPVQSTEIPSPQILEELRIRLLEKDECYPACAGISDMHVIIGAERLSMALTIDAHTDTAVPVPSHVKHWLPAQVMIDGTPAEGLFRRKNALWVLIPSGKHLVKMTGPIRQQNTLQLPFVLKPHRVTIDADGWLTEGVHPDGTIDSQLAFKRITAQESEHTEILETGLLPPFAMIERNILLGLDWKIQTRIQRISPPGSGIVLDIPLLPGESVTTEGVRVQGGVAKINLRADRMDLSWESFLEPSDQIFLEHKETNDWTEIWKVDVSPIFHLEYEGIPVILHKTGTRWYPTWHPWPGEKVALNISRPEGIEGRTMTIEKSHLELRPGKDTTAVRMVLSIKSSQGGQHAITLPSDAELQEVKIDGKIQPIRQNGRLVAFPITPGQQLIELKWIEAKGMSTRYESSRVDLGSNSVNASADIYLPLNRWPLFAGGEQLVGPAVLFWSVLIVILIVAAGLSKTGWTPVKFYHWFMLGIGMSMSNLAAGVIVNGWLIALDRQNKISHVQGRRYNLMQLAMVFLTIAALGSLVFAISRGLLGHPDMNITGNGSSAGLLRWYHDVSDHTLPQAWVFSIPMFTYRIAMLAWALWISFWLIGILKWAWQKFSTPAIWYRMPPRIPKQKEA